MNGKMKLLFPKCPVCGGEVASKVVEKTLEGRQKKYGLNQGQGRGLPALRRAPLFSGYRKKVRGGSEET